MTSGSVPLVIGSAGQFRALRAALVDLHYDEPSICGRACIRSIFEFQTMSEHRENGIGLCVTVMIALAGAVTIAC